MMIVVVVVVKCFYVMCTTKIIPADVCLFAPPTAHLLLCRCLFCWCSLQLGSFVWVEADLLHLSTNTANCLRCAHTPNPGLNLWVENIYLLVPSLPPLLSRHGRSRAHCVRVKIIMKLLPWILEKQQKTFTIDYHVIKVPFVAMSAQHSLCPHLARDLIADWHNAAVCQLQHTHHFAGHHIQRQLGNHGNTTRWDVRKTVTH